MHKALPRATLIGAMLVGGLLFASISQAQDATVQQERGAELIAAVGGPASTAHLIPYLSDKAAVEVRDAEVVGSPSEVGDLATPNPGVAPDPVAPSSVTPTHVATANPSLTHP